MDRQNSGEFRRSSTSSLNSQNSDSFVEDPLESSDFRGSISRFSRFEYFLKGDSTPQDEGTDPVFAASSGQHTGTSAVQEEPMGQYSSPFLGSPGGGAKMIGALGLGKRKTESDQPASVIGKKLALDKSLSYSCSDDLSQSCVSFCDDLMDSSVKDWLGSFQSLESSKKVMALTFLVDQCCISEIRHLRKTIEPYFQKDFIRCLPKELALCILSLLDSEDLCRVAQTSRYWRMVAEDNLMWREKCEEAGFLSPALPPPPGPKGLCYARSMYKSVYLRHSKINDNWRKFKSPLANQRSLKGHDEHVITCLQICGDKVVSGSDDNTLRVWNVAKGECMHVLTGHTGGVWSSHMTIDGRYLASGSTDRTVKIWDTETGECLHTLQGHTSTVRCMSLRGTTLVTGSRDTTLRVWNMLTGELEHVLIGHLAAVRCVQFDGIRAVSGAYDYTIKVWDVERERCSQTLGGHTNRIYSLQLDSERNLAISGSLDTTIRVWDIGSGECLHTLMGHQSLTSGMELRGKILVSGNADSTLKVWDISDGTCMFTLSGQHRHKSAVTSLQFLENGLVVTSSDDGTVKLWDSNAGTFVRDLVRLDSGGSGGGCIWRLKATPTTLVCAVGSRHGTEDTKLIVLDFNAEFP